MKHFPKAQIIEALCRRNQSSSTHCDAKPIPSKQSAWDKVRGVFQKIKEMAQPVKDIIALFTSVSCSILMAKNIILGRKVRC